jgi:hypothetical protein
MTNSTQIINIPRDKQYFCDSFILNTYPGSKYTTAPANMAAVTAGQ